MKKLSITEVFTPNDTPVHTYVDRAGARLEKDLEEALKTPKMVTSVSGPSKAGKSVLIHKVVDPDTVILISGASIKSADDLWSQTLQWMGTSEAETSTDSVTSSGSLSGEVKGGISALIAKGEAAGKVETALSGTSATSSTRRTGGLLGVVKEIGGSEFLLFIDDFHYIPNAVQGEVGRQIKAAAEQGVRICAASVPHRSDDVVRSNPELSGRISAVNIDYWSIHELKMIGSLGFGKLGIDLANSVVERLASEAFGSPQLMQSLCLNLCREMDIYEELPKPERREVDDKTLRKTFERTSLTADYSSVVKGLHSGPKERGQERKQFSLVDGSKGDVYRVVLMAISSDPPSLTFDYDEINSRVSKVTKDEKPSGSSVNQALTQMDTPLAKNLSPRVPIIEWDENNLNILEPYFLFFLRSSPKLRQLGGV